MDALYALPDCALGFFPCYFLFGCKDTVAPIFRKRHFTLPSSEVSTATCLTCTACLVRGGRISISTDVLEAKKKWNPHQEVYHSIM